jgi:hypothetical protein
MTDEKFLVMVRGQAESRVEFDMQTFMSYFAPEGLEDLRKQMEAGGGAPVRGGRAALALMPREFEIVEAETDGDTGRSMVRFKGAGSYVLKQEWRQIDGSWRVVKFERPPELVKKPTFFNRLNAFLQQFAPVSMSRPPGGFGGAGGRRTGV